MKIWVLTENTACRPDLQPEHGLSIYVETGTKRLLFDMGQTAAFAENAGKLGIDLSQVDFAVISHGHYDHGGGLERFLEINSKAPVYVSRYAFGEYYNAAGRYIGLDPKWKNNSRIIPVQQAITLAPGIMLLPGDGYDAQIPADCFGLQKKESGALVPDVFLHEQYLMILERGKRVLFSGCSHRGIVNIARWIPCDVCIGGFHFMKLAPESNTVKNAALALLEGNTTYYTCHCTGPAQFDAMKTVMGDRLRYLSSGSYLEI